MRCCWPRRCCGTLSLFTSGSEGSTGSRNLEWSLMEPWNSKEHPMKRLAILGSTGSIGQSTLSIVEQFPDRYQVAALAAGRNLDEAFAQTARWRPKLVSLATEELANSLAARLRQAGVTGIEVVHGTAGHRRLRHPSRGGLCGFGHCGRGGTRGDARGDSGRQARRPGQQGMHGGRRRDSHRRRPRAQRAHPAHRQRAQRRPPVPARRRSR